MAAAGDVLLAAVIGAQGLKGEVKAKIFTDQPGALARYGLLHDAKGRTYEITAFRPTKPGEAVIAFAGVSDRNAAEALKGTELFVRRAALPATGDDEFYHADLIGLEAFDTEGLGLEYFGHTPDIDPVEEVVFSELNRLLQDEDPTLFDRLPGELVAYNPQRRCSKRPFLRRAHGRAG